MREYSLDAEEVLKLFPDAKIILDDDVYYFVGNNDWLKILSEMPVQPRYRKDRFDCDNFTDLARSYLAGNYGINGCGKGYGHIPEYHCFCVLLVPEGFVCYEPQTHELKDYPIEKIYFG